MKSSLDWPSIKTALRTAGALMLGNVFVVGLIAERPNWPGLVWLLLIGSSVIIGTSVTRAKE